MPVNLNTILSFKCFLIIRKYNSHSLGGAIAIKLLSKELNSKRCMALIIQSTFTSMQDLCRYLAQKYVNLSLFENEEYFLNMKFESKDLIKRVKSSIFIICGLKDQIVPPFMSSTLFDNAINAKRKELCQLKARGHNDLHEDEIYYEKLERMLNF